MKYIIYLAAGNSTRFGTENKLLYKIKNEPMYMHGLLKLVEISKEQVVKIVVVSQYNEILEQSKKIDDEIITIYSPLSKKGISYSIRAGLEKIKIEENDKIMFMVADQPYIKKDTIKKILKLSESESLISTSFGEKTGNPTMFSAKYVKELLSLHDDMGGRIVINNHIEECSYVEAEDEIELFDIDEISKV